MTHVVETLIQVLIGSGIIWAATMALKKVFHKQLSPRMHLLVWTVLIARLVCPVTIDMGVHFFTVPISDTAATADDNADGAGTAFRMWRAMSSPSALHAPTTSEALTADVGDRTHETATSAALDHAQGISWNADPAELAVSVWIIGMLAGAAISLAGYDRLRRDLRSRLVDGSGALHMLFQDCLHEAGIRKRVVLAVQNELAGPALMYPNIVLVPENIYDMDPEAAKMAFRHELTHFTRKDHLKSLGLNILRIVWWFNPFVWLSVRAMREDIETACDSDVVRRLGKDGKSAYAKAVLSMFGRTETCPAVLGMAFGGARKNAERRIRGIYMKKKSSIRGRTAAACIAGILAVVCFTTACQPTPELEAVVNQRKDIPENALNGESATVDPMATTAPAATYSAAEHWTETIDKAENFKVTADLDIMVPDVSAYPVEKIAPKEITQEVADRLINYFAPDAEFYRTTQQRTKAEWEEDILNLRETLAEDIAKGDTDAAEQEQATIDYWTELYENAPETVDRTAATTTYDYMYDFYDGTPLKEYGTNYIGISTEAPDGSIKQFDVRRRDDSDPSQFPYFMYLNADYQVQSTDEETKENNALARQSLEDADQAEELERLNKLDAEVSRRLALYDENPMSTTEAAAQAAEVLEALGIYGTQITLCENALIGPYTGERTDALLDGIVPDLSTQAMYLEFRRENGGIPCMEPQSQFINPAESQNMYSAPFRPETGSMLIDVNGNVRMFDWESPSEAVEIISTDSALISLDEAKTRLIDELYRRELGMSEEYLEDHSITYDVESMELVMGYVDLQNEPQDAIAVPAWRMTARGRDSGDAESTILTEQELMISALDGRPILMAASLQ